MPYNEIFIELLEQLENIMTHKGEIFRARAYRTAKENLLGYLYPIEDISILKGYSGIGKTILEKLQEYVTTGRINLIEQEKNHPIHIFSQIYGIGPKKATQLISAGITTIGELRKNQHLLNEKQQIGLYYYEELLEKIPRNEIDAYSALFERVFARISKEYKYEIAGSYRRGKEMSGDIDVIICTNNPNICKRFINILLEEQKIIILSRGENKCLVIAKLDHIQSTLYTARRIDFLFTKPAEYAFALLYFTGNKSFNTIMRNYALQLGYTMNEHTICKLDGDKKQFIDNTFNTEEDIFSFLGLEYVIPTERNDGSRIRQIKTDKS